MSPPAVVNLTVISPRNPLLQHVPIGFGYVGEIFEQAGLRDSLTIAQSPDAWLVRSLRHLATRFPRRIRVRWIDLWSLPGLLFAIRYRIRSYPTVVINGDHVYTGSDPAAFEELAMRQLETPRG